MTTTQFSSAADRLQHLAACALGVGATALADEAGALASRTSEGRFHVACLGQFKRGKSTLLNGLIGKPVLPTGVVPVTSVVTIVRHGPEPRLRVHFRDRRSEEAVITALSGFVTESANPGNEKGVAVVELFLPSPILASGLCLVDTPGIGSTSPLATAVTREFVPQVDAALVVLGGDPPISGEELALIDALRSEARDFVYVINKADRLSDSELVDVVVFTQRTLMDRTGVVPDSLFIVSASERIAQGPTRDWERLENRLSALTEDNRKPWLERRTQAVFERLARQVRDAVDVSMDATTRSAAENDQRISELRAWLKAAQHTLPDLSVLLEAEQRTFEHQLRSEVGQRAERVVHDSIADLQGAMDRLTVSRWAAASSAFEQAQMIARRAVQTELLALERYASAAVEATTRRLLTVANDFLERLITSELGGARLPPLEADAHLAGQRRFYFTDLMTLTSTTPIDWLLDAVVPKPTLRRRAGSRARTYLQRLVETNSSRAVNDVLERLHETRRQIESEIRARMNESVAAAERAVSRAHELQQSGEFAVRAEVHRLRSLRERIDGLVSGSVAELLLRLHQ